MLWAARPRRAVLAISLAALDAGDGRVLQGAWRGDDRGRQRADRAVRRYVHRELSSHRRSDRALLRRPHQPIADGHLGIALGTVLLPEMSARLAAATRGRRSRAEPRRGARLLLTLPFIAAFFTIPDTMMRAVFAHGAFGSARPTLGRGACGLWRGIAGLRAGAHASRRLSMRAATR